MAAATPARSSGHKQARSRSYRKVSDNAASQLQEDEEGGTVHDSQEASSPVGLRN